MQRAFKEFFCQSEKSYTMISDMSGSTFLFNKNENYLSIYLYVDENYAVYFY